MPGVRDVTTGNGGGAEVVVGAVCATWDACSAGRARVSANRPFPKAARNAELAAVATSSDEKAPKILQIRRGLLRRHVRIGIKDVWSGLSRSHTADSCPINEPAIQRIWVELI
jgi:hypothetical protein